MDKFVSSSHGSGRFVKHVEFFDVKIRHDFNNINSKITRKLIAFKTMGDCLLSNFDLAKLHFDRSNIIRNFKIIYARNFSLCCVQLLYIQTCN